MSLNFEALFNDVTAIGHYTQKVCPIYSPSLVTENRILFNFATNFAMEKLEKTGFQSPIMGNNFMCTCVDI